MDTPAEDVQASEAACRTVVTHLDSRRPAEHDAAAQITQVGFRYSKLDVPQLTWTLCLPFRPIHELRVMQPTRRPVILLFANEAKLHV